MPDAKRKTYEVAIVSSDRENLVSYEDVVEFELNPSTGIKLDRLVGERLKPMTMFFPTHAFASVTIAGKDDG